MVKEIGVASRESKTEKRRKKCTGFTVEFADNGGFTVKKQHKFVGGDDDDPYPTFAPDSTLAFADKESLKEWIDSLM